MTVRGVLLVLGLIGCGKDLPPQITSFAVEPSTAAPGDDVMVSIEIANFELRTPAAEMGQALRPTHAGHVEGSYPDGGHFHVYLDDTETNPMLIDCPDYCQHGAAHSQVRVRLWDDSPLGEHTVIARLNNDAHLYLTPEIRAEAMLTVAR